MTMKSVTVFLLAAFLSVATTVVNVTGNNPQAGTAYAQDEGNGDNNQEGIDEADGDNNQEGTPEPDGDNNQTGVNINCDQATGVCCDQATCCDLVAGDCSPA